MEDVLRSVLEGMRGGETRIRILHAIHERPRNVNRLAKSLDLDYETVSYHLRLLEERDLVTASGDEYGAVYLPTDSLAHHWDLIEELTQSGG